MLTAIQIRRAIDNIKNNFLFFDLQSNSSLARIVVYKSQGKNSIKYKDNKNKKSFFVKVAPETIVVTLEYLDNTKEDLYFLGYWQMIRFIYLLKPLSNPLALTIYFQLDQFD